MDPKFPMRNTTLCYLEQDDAYLMLHRVTKKNDLNHDKWIGVGGKFEPFESPEDCLLREVQEETGLTLTSYRCRGVVTFLLGELTEYMFLYTADAWTGTLVKDAARNEGILEWVPKEQVEQLPIWEGDKIFFRLLEEDRPFFSLKLRYEDDTLAEAVLGGKRLLGCTLVRAKRVPEKHPLLPKRGRHGSGAARPRHPQRSRPRTKMLEIRASARRSLDRIFARSRFVI